MENTKLLLDTDVIVSWLTKEVDPKNQVKLWEAPYKILKEIEAGKQSGFITIINLMETIFVLRRKKRWGEDEVFDGIRRIQDINNLNLLVPDESDIISAYNLQTLFNLDPFDALYFAVLKKTADCIISRDEEFIKLINKAERKEIAFTPEKFLKELSRNKKLIPG
jgi:predicted nucleic acid-binding protein